MKKQLLIVEDDPLMAEAAADYFTGKGRVGGVGAVRAEADSSDSAGRDDAGDERLYGVS